MRAYLAVLKDSYREAVASRVLLVAVVLIVLFLLALAPISVYTDAAKELRTSDFLAADSFAAEILQADGADQTPAGWIYEKLPTDARERLKEVAANDGMNQPGPPGRRNPARRLRRILNEHVIDSEDLGTFPGWAPEAPSTEIAELLELPASSDADRQVRNVRLLAAAFPDYLRIRDTNGIYLGYAGMELLGPFNMPADQKDQVVRQSLTTILSLLMGFFGVFTSIIFTAGIIPRTFEPGEISLLLSKPVYRSWLYVVKFFGGCIFTLICATVMVFGLWLIAGLRVGSWQTGVLYCIPIYVFLFAIYFSVSAWSGARWRNPIISVVAVAIFWLVLTGMGTARNLTDALGIQTYRITEAGLMDGKAFSINGARVLQLLDVGPEAAGAGWQAALEPSNGTPVAFANRTQLANVRIIPVTDQTRDRVLVLQPQSTFAGNAPPNLMSLSAENEWEPELLGGVPDVVPTILIDSRHRILLPGSRDVYEFASQSAKEAAAQQFFDKYLGGLIPRANAKVFPGLGDDLPRRRPGFQAALCPPDDSIYIFDDGSVCRLTVSEEGRYTQVNARDLETSESAVIAAGEHIVVVALGDGRVLWLDAETLETTREETLPEGTLPRSAAASPDGTSLCVLTHDNTLLLADGSSGEAIEWRPDEDGSTAVATFDSQSRLLVSDGRETLLAYEIGADAPAVQAGSSKGLLYALYDYAINPIYTVFPKPGELDNLVRYVVSGERSVALQNEGNPSVRDNLAADRITVDIWTPVWTNLAFVVFMLGLGCLYISRSDF